MRVDIYGKPVPYRFSGDPHDIAPLIAEAVREAVLSGESIGIDVWAERTYCDKCDGVTPSSEPRRHQETRYERGYYECAVCGYVKVSAGIPRDAKLGVGREGA